MKLINRRKFVKNSAVAAASPIFAGWANIFAKSVSETIIRTYPHPWMPKINFVYLADENEDPFKSDIQINQNGIVIPSKIEKKFSINTKWFIEGFGFVILSADNGGEFFSSDQINSHENLNLNYEFAKSRVSRNRKVKEKYLKEGVSFSREVNYLQSLSEELFEEASKKINDGETCAKKSDKSLLYALYAGEKIELERARFKIEMQKVNNAFFGCETRQMIWAQSEGFTERFPEVFNFGTVTHYVWDSWYELFEPKEGEYNWGIKDDIVDFLIKNNIEIEGRPLFWFHPIVTPDWLKNKNFQELKEYIVKHTNDLLSHYGDKILQWEVVNEYHDWANIFDHTPEQITEITRLACDQVKEVNPKVKKILNNCMPWAEYAARGRMARMDASRPLRSPRKFIEDLETANVDYDILGIQVYFPDRDLSDIVRMLERFEKFNKPIYITEIGATSGPTKETVFKDSLGISEEPYAWHRAWDEELQADWLEQVYTIFYSRPQIKAINWYDFSDFRPFIVNGGIVRENCSPKMSYNRLKDLLRSWKRLPKSD